MITYNRHLCISRRNCGQTPRWVQAGFTLVELMVAMAIGLLVIFALTTLVVNISRNNSEMSKINRQTENGRYALQVLETDIAHAGYLGGVVPQFDDLTSTAAPVAGVTLPDAIPDPCTAAAWTAAHKNNLVGIPVQGYEITAASTSSPVCASIVASAKTNTDVLVVRHLERCALGDTGCPAAVANDVYVQAARCGISPPSPAYAVEKYNTANQATLFPLKNRDCTTQSELRKFVSNLYYVRNFAVTSGDGVPTLMRSQSVGGVQAAAEPLVEGIDGFSIEYGIDDVSETGEAVDYNVAVSFADLPTAIQKTPKNRGDGVPDGAYVRCTVASPCTVAQLVNTVAVRVHLLVRNESRTPGYTDTKTYQLGGTTLGPFNDGFKRHLFTQTIRLHNISSRRETPP